MTDSHGTDRQGSRNFIYYSGGDEINTLQQEIKEFHEQLKPTLKKVLEQYGKRTTPIICNNVIKPCKRLIQKCSFKSNFDASRLCSLAYWLYIYGHKQLALEICELTHGVDFALEYWSSNIATLYGLEMRIARELLGENRKSNIPSKFLDYYLSKTVIKKLSYPQILRQEEILNYKRQSRVEPLKRKTAKNVIDWINDQRNPNNRIILRRL